MSTSAVTQPNQQEQGGGLFKLSDSLVWDIGTPKEDVRKTCQSSEGDAHINTPIRLGEELANLFLQPSPGAGIRTGPAGARDSGYDSLHRRLTVLERLVQTHPVWLRLNLSQEDATHNLKEQPAGTFLVRNSSTLERKVLTVRMEKDSAVTVKDFPVNESQYTFSLEGSGLSFVDLVHLVAFCCISRDVLPFTLKLPEATTSASAPADPEGFSSHRAGSWNAQLWSGAAATYRPPPPAETPQLLRLRTRTPSELGCHLSNGALCFINPLFIKVHRSSGDQRPATNTSAIAPQDPRGERVINQDNKVTRSICTKGHSSNSELRDPKSLQDKQQSSTSSPADCRQKLVTQCPPPRPAPPPPVHSVPEKISWINPKEKVEEREEGDGLLFLSRLSISPSSLPAKSLSISSPISIRQPRRRPPSLSYLSSSPHQARVSLSSSHEGFQCHQALEDWTVEKVHFKAKRPPGDAGSATTQDSSFASEESLVRTITQVEMPEGADKEVGGVGQRLSDMSLSTDSSDSVDLSHSPAFFLPPLHDPSPPTVADFNIHLPLSIPPSHSPYSSIDPDDEDEDDENDEEPDYGVSLESDLDQDQDVTMVPAGGQTKRQPSASALILQRALRGHLHKMSGVFSSLLTPEKRVIRKVVELSREKGSYFGCLVQDYLSYMDECATQAWQGYASGPELLQTVRQFITQMKSYLRQTSEMEPLIESFVPKDDIDRVLEKAMHKCVLKALRPLLAVALQQFQVCSGAWQELKDHLSLAKARQPQEMGVADALPPDAVAIEKIRQNFHRMYKLYSPEKKVSMLLRVCKLIYTIMEDNSGRLYGADDFLPMLTYVLAQCDMPQLDNEILYMMELLDPSLLNGEGGYYLTSAFGAMSLIRNFREEQAARVLSSETRDTLHQWHRRRTAQRSGPSIDDFQNFLRVALQELDSGCTAKTLQVRPHATVEEVCQLCASKFKVSDPENYGLFLVMEGSRQQLAPDTHPQRIKAELHSHPQSAPFHFVFRPVADSDAVSSAPCGTPANLSHLTVTSDPQLNLVDPGMNFSGPPAEPVSA